MTVISFDEFKRRWEAVMDTLPKPNAREFRKLKFKGMPRHLQKQVLEKMNLIELRDDAGSDGVYYIDLNAEHQAEREERLNHDHSTS